MSDEPTCGQGLAAHSDLPRTLSAVLAAMAGVLDNHRTSLDVKDPDGRAEDEAYATLVSEFRGIADALKATAERMSGYRDLPMAPHDEAALMSGEAIERLQRLVRTERELLRLLETWVERYDAMLAGMTSSPVATGDREIARVGERRVMYAEVFCDRAYAAQNPRWLQGRTVEEACLAEEQEQFQRVLTRILLEHACKLHQCEPSDADIDPFRSRVLKDEALLQRLVTEARKVPEAIRRVYRGEPIEAVHREVIAPMGHSLDQFRMEAGRYRSLEVVERYLAKDFAASARSHYEQQARFSALRALLRKRLEAAAAADKRPLEQTADDLLQSIIEKAGVTIVDPQFRLPPGREIFL